MPNDVGPYVQIKLLGLIICFASYQITPFDNKHQLRVIRPRKIRS